MRYSKQVDTRVYDAFMKRMTMLNKVDKFKKWCKTVDAQFVEFFHAAGISETDPRWLAMKIDIYENGPVGKGGQPLNWEGALTIVGEKTDKHLVVHGGYILDADGNPVERELTAEEKAMVDDTCDELYSTYLFTGVRLTKEASLGPFTLERSAGVRAATLMAHKDVIESGHWQKAREMECGQGHLYLLENGISPLSAGLNRRQPGSRKVRYEAVANSRTLEPIDPESKIVGEPFLIVRFRKPQMAPGEINLAMAMHIAGMIGPSKKKFPFMLVHRSAWQVADKITKWFDDRKAPAHKRFMLSFDVTGMEKFVSTYVGRTVLRKLDGHLGDRLGIYSVLHNNPVVEPSGKPDDMLISCEDFDYTHDDLMGYGTRSGRADVVACNQVASSSALRMLIRRVLGLDLSVQQLSGDPDQPLAVLSMTDDNLLITDSEEIFKAFAGMVFDVMNLEIEFETHPNFEPGKGGEFLATTYHVTDKGIRPIKNWRGGILNLVCSENGLEYSPEHEFWRRKSPKGDKVVPAGVGYVLRMQEYLLDFDDGMAMWEYLASLWGKHFGKKWYEMFPVSSYELANIAALVNQEESIDGIEYLLTERPDYIHRAAADPDSIPEELQEKLYLRVSPDRYREWFGDDIPIGEPVASDTTLSTYMPNLENFRKFLDIRVQELRRAGL